MTALDPAEIKRQLHELNQERKEVISAFVHATVLAAQDATCMHNRSASVSNPLIAWGDS